MPSSTPISLIIALCGLCTLACKREPSLLKALSPRYSGIDFVNTVEEDSVYNVMNFMNIYTGAGVAAGDVNNDGLTDLYFSGNQNTGRLYLNRGDLQFEDVTEAAGLANDRWGTGVSMVDIDQDGWLDIYVNVSGIDAYGNTANLLFRNQGDGTFTEEAAKWGIADPRQTMHASFFDYDGDRDLDLFLIVNPADMMVGGVNRIRDRMLSGEAPSTDVLYRNNGNGSFTDVSYEAGILVEGYSLGAAISDINLDGRPDIYVSNDFLTNDILYINQGDGTFKDMASTYLRHTSFASMGNDIADINNDGLPDIYVLDMLPEDNYRRKMIIPAANYNKFQLALDKGYDPQYTRNTLQLNNGDGSFSEIAWLAGLSSTDWSWSALWADLDNDRDRDLMVTNGFYRDLGNLDYINYQLSRQSPMGTPEAKQAEKRRTIEALEQVPLHDYLFENLGDLQFADRSETWGFTEPGYSNGAAYADLDNDGDLDLAINRLNQTAQVFQNRASDQFEHHFLRLRLAAAPPNRQALGAKVWLYIGPEVQFHEHFLYRGYESTVEPIAHFGLGEYDRVDSIRITWPDGTTFLYKDVLADQTLTLSQEDRALAATPLVKPSRPSPFHETLADSLGLAIPHRENPHIDFDLQPLVPHMLSRLGPGLAVGDINGDGREDLLAGGAAGQYTRLFIQGPDGRFEPDTIAHSAPAEDAGLLLFDADRDGDLDLYAASGGVAHPAEDLRYQDRLYLNDGQGRFSLLPEAFPPLAASSSCVVGGDFDGDGDLDLFVGGRVQPGKYPFPGRSRLLRNDSPPRGIPRFTDLGPDSGIPLPELGMVSAALWTDFNQDDRLDLIVTGEFMPLRFFENRGGTFVEVTENTGVAEALGWWNSLVGADFDADGDTDYVAGNLGLNSRYRASEHEPLCIYANDYDKNGTVDPVMCYYTQGENYIAHARDEMVRQIPAMRNRFQSYEDFARATFQRSFLPQELASAYVVRSNTFESSYFENLGNGRFTRHPLPRLAQVAPVYGMLPLFANEDARLDLLLVGNAYGTEPSHGRYDASNGLLLLGDGQGGFSPQPAWSSGFRAPHDAKALVSIYQAGGDPLIVVGNNDEASQVFSCTEGGREGLYPGPDDRYALFYLNDGSIMRREFYHGQGYLSQTSPAFRVSREVRRILFFSAGGQTNREWLAASD